MEDEMSDKPSDQPVAIVFDEKIVGMWVFPMRTPEGNYLAAIRELVPDEKYELTYRFRYYKDDEVFDSKDERSWYRGTLSGTRNYVIGSFRAVVKLLAQVQGVQYDEVLYEGDLRAFSRKVQALPCMFMRQEK
jgi:hypothetical protein